MASPLVNRVAAIVLLGVVGLAIWLAVVSPMLDHTHEVSASIDDALVLRDRLTVLAEHDRAPEAYRTAIDAYRGDFLAGASDATIGAELQTRLRAIVNANQSELISAQALPARKAGALQAIGLRLQIRGALDKVQRIVHAIESLQPLLFIERAVIRQDQAAGAAPARSGLDAVRLFVELDVIGARWPTSAEIRQ
jgi:hypothetical protein